MRTYFRHLALAATAFASLYGAPADRDEDVPILVGALFNQVGVQEQLDGPSFRGAKLAVEQINAAGGVLGRQMELVLGDGKSRPDLVAKAVEKIVRKEATVSAFVGLSDTDMVRAAAPPAAAAGRLLLTSGATSPQLPSAYPGTVYLACFGDNTQAAAAAEFAFQELGARTVSVLFDSTDTYTQLLERYFRESFQQLGGTIVSRVSYSPGQAEASVSKLQHADVLFLAAHLPQDAVDAVKLLRKNGWTAPILGGDGFDEQTAWTSQADVSDVYFTTHAYLAADATDQQTAAFMRDYAAAFPGSPPSAFSALGYDAVRLLAEAMRLSGSAEPGDIERGLMAIRDFDGVTGVVSFDGSAIPSKSVTIIEIERGVFRKRAESSPTSVAAP